MQGFPLLLFNGDGVIVMIGDADAFAHRFPAQQMDQAVRHAAVGHALDAEAVGSGGAGDAGEYGAADTDLAPLGLDLNHSILPFRSG